jgi:hypothetical protein
MVRLALVNNCTVGQNPITCVKLGKPQDSSVYTKLIRDHSDIYPSGDCDINFVFPVDSSEEEVIIYTFTVVVALPLVGI